MLVAAMFLVGCQTTGDGLGDRTLRDQPSDLLGYPFPQECRGEIKCDKGVCRLGPTSAAVEFKDYAEMEKMMTGPVLGSFQIAVLNRGGKVIVNNNLRGTEGDTAARMGLCGLRTGRNLQK
jgi:hypothetical protein